MKRGNHYLIDNNRPVPQMYQRKKNLPLIPLLDDNDHNSGDQVYFNHHNESTTTCKRRQQRPFLLPKRRIRQRDAKLNPMMKISTAIREPQEDQYDALSDDLMAISCFSREEEESAVRKDSSIEMDQNIPLLPLLKSEQEQYDEDSRIVKESITNDMISQRQRQKLPLVNLQQRHYHTSRNSLEEISTHLFNPDDRESR